MPELTDLDPMPFGKYKGTPMQDVPVDYLHWLWTKSGMSHQTDSNVHHYIKKSLHALKLEDSDLIW